MKLIDKYIVGKFIATYLYLNLLLTLVIIIFDISEKIDDFIEHSAPLQAVIVDYYFNFIPFLLNMFIGLITFVAVIYFTSRLAFNTEIIAILSSGVSFRRLLAPYLVTALLLSGISFSLSNFVIPTANKVRLDFEMRYLGKHRPRHESHIHFQISPGNYISVQHFDPFSDIGYRAILTEVGDTGLRKVVSADVLRWDSLETKWHFDQYAVRTFDEEGEHLRVGSTLDTVLAVGPADLSTRVRDVGHMGFRQLRRFIAESRIRGTENIIFYEVEKHQRLAYPFATVILTLIGVALSSRKVRGGIGLHIAMGLSASFIYILFMKFSETFATNGNLHPGVAAWVPNALFFILAVYLINKAPK